MTTTLLILLGVLVLGFWISVMILWWHQSNETGNQTLSRVAIKNIEKVIRLTRRSYYASGLYGKRAFTFGSKTVAKAFMHTFPKAAIAFQKHDSTLGLEHGPSSYFLHSISSSKTAAVKPKVRRKKIVA